MSPCPAGTADVPWCSKWTLTGSFHFLAKLGHLNCTFKNPSETLQKFPTWPVITGSGESVRAVLLPKHEVGRSESYLGRSQICSLIHFYPPSIKIFPRIQVGICCSPVRAELSLALRFVYTAHRMYFWSFSIKGAMYTFNVIFSAVGMSNFWRRDQSVRLCPFSWESLSHGVILALQGFLFMALWVLNSCVSWLSSSDRAESSLGPSSPWSLLFWDFAGGGICKGENAQPWEKYPASRWQWDTVSRWQYGLLWTRLWVAVVLGGWFAVGVAVWAEGRVPALQVSCVVSKVISFHGHPWWPSGLGVIQSEHQLNLLSWFEKVISLFHLFCLEIRAVPSHYITEVLVLMGRWEEFMAWGGEGDTVTYSDSCMKFISMFRKPHLPWQWNSRKSQFNLFLLNKHSVEHSFLCSFGIWILGFCN